MKSKNPRPDDIRTAREKAGLTQQDAASLIGYSLRAWESWEGGQRKMRRVIFDMFVARVKDRRS